MADRSDRKADRRDDRERRGPGDRGLTGDLGYEAGGGYGGGGNDSAYSAESGYGGQAGDGGSTTRGAYAGGRYGRADDRGEGEADRDATRDDASAAGRDDATREAAAAGEERWAGPSEMREAVERSGVTGWMDGGTREEREEPNHGDAARPRAARPGGRARRKESRGE